MLSRSLVVVAVAMGSIAFGQDTNAKFSFKSPAAPAKRLFQELTRATGTSLVASASVAEDVLVLNLSDVTISDAMAKIAQAVHGEWRKEASGYVLYRGPNLEGADQRAENAAKVASFRANLNHALAEQRKMGAFNSDTAKKLVDTQRKMEQQMSQSQGGPIRIAGDFGQVASQTPSARAITALLSRLSDAQISALMSGNRTVFGLNPTRMQLPMPNGSAQILNAFIRDTQTFNDVRQRNQTDQNPTETRQIVINGFGADGGGDGDPKLGIGYALLIGQPNQRGPNVSVSLLVADPNGKTIASGQYFLNSVPPTGPQPSVQQIPPNETPLPISELAKEFGKVLNSLSGGGGGRGQMRVMTLAVGSSIGGTFTVDGGGDGKSPVLSDELRNLILNPEKTDPLAIAVGEGFSLASNAKGNDLVAYLADPTMSSLSQVVASSPTPSAFLNAAKDQGGYTIKTEGGWIVASPDSPASARSRRVNRFALGNALRQLNSKGFLTLDEWADFAVKQVKSPSYAEIDDNYLRIINTSAADAGLGQFNNGGWQTLQFYASLSTAQRQTLTQSGRVPLNTLSSYQTGLVTAQVFNSWDGPSVQNRQDQGQGRPISGAFIFGAQTAQTERTIILPFGIPRVGFLNMSQQVNEIVQAQSQGGGARFLNADSLAFERVRAERPEFVGFGQAATLDQFRMASQKTVSFQFQFSPEVSFTRQIEDNSPSNREFASFDRLPNAFRKTVDEKTEQLKKAFGQGRGSGQQPPPNS